MFCECASEFLNFRATDGILPPLRLEVDAVEAEAVFVDDAVNATVAAATDGAPGVLERAAVAHF